MKRTLALPLAVAGTLVAAGFSANALAAGPTVIASVYVPTVDVEGDTANPSALLLDVRQPVGRIFWLGAQLATSLDSDQILPGVDVEIGSSFNVNVGAQAEFNHYIAGYAYVGYGAAKLDATGGNIDGNGVDWGLGLQFRMADAVIADVGYTTLFDGNMEDSSGTQNSTTIAGPHVGIGYRF